MPDNEGAAEIPTREEFASFLVKHNKGQTHDEMTGKLAELVAGVQETKKPGALALTFKVSPVKDEDDMVRVDVDIKSKVPVLDRRASLFYVTAGGGLSKDHPRQADLFSIQGEQTR